VSSKYAAPAMATSAIVTPARKATSITTITAAVLSMSG